METQNGMERALILVDKEWSQYDNYRSLPSLGSIMKLPFPGQIL